MGDAAAWSSPERGADKSHAYRSLKRFFAGPTLWLDVRCLRSLGMSRYLIDDKLLPGSELSIAFARTSLTPGNTISISPWARAKFYDARAVYPARHLPPTGYGPLS